jgi:ATPase subunit of ABC transporter with duplicated ATPase domains
MTRASKGEARRNEGFRVADVRQVRVETLERTIRALRMERDDARHQLIKAQRDAMNLATALTTARTVLTEMRRSMEAMSGERDAERSARKVAEARPTGLLSRLFGGAT